MAEFLQVGDLHLTDSGKSGGLSKYVPEADAMVISELEKVLTYGRNKGIHTVFQAGDVCDNPRMSYEATLALASFLDRNTDFQFHFTIGNHDMFTDTPEGGHSLELLYRMYRKSKHVHIHLRPTTVNLDDVPVRFLPFPHTKFDPKALNVFHHEVRGAKNDTGRAFDSEELPASKAVALGGHLHTAHRIRNTYYSGTLYQTNFGESLPKYFHHVEFNSVEDYEVKLVKHKPEYTLHNIVLQSREDLDLIPRGPTELVKLIIQDGAEVAVSDYAHLSNVVQHKNFKTKEDLAAVLTEDLTEGQEVTFRVSDFFKVWISSYDVPDEMRGRIRQTRRRVLNSVRAT